jgi:hypothetical protein
MIPARFTLALAGCSLLACSTPDPVPDGSGPDAAASADVVAPFTDVAASDANAPRDAGSNVPSDSGTPADSGPAPGALLRDRYPADRGIAEAPSVLFFDDFESGWGRWDAPRADTRYLHLEQGATAHAGGRYLRSTVTRADLQESQYISASPRFAFRRRVPQMFWRFYARFPTVAPNPHHWVRVAAGTAAFASSGLANTVPRGDQGFWFDFDATNDDVFNFYAYWHRMRSGRCNDGSATPGCAGDQGTTYYYGNVFQPRTQTAFPRDEWFCIELGAQANTVGANDGSLIFWINDREVGRYAPGRPAGTWLRATFHEGGCSFSACTPPAPFEGFNFRTSADVLFKEIFLDAYYERESSAAKRMQLQARGLTVSDEQTILYDDVVVATERIGCRRAM